VTIDRVSDQERRYRLALATAALVGLAVRLWVVLGARPTCSPPLSGAGSCFRVAGLARWYHVQADLLADGKWFVHPDQWLANGDLVDSALHPPGYTAFLGAFSVLGLDTATQHRVLSSLLGVVTVVVVGLLGRRLGGRRAGALAAAFAAVYPMLWINDGMLQAESLYALLAAALLIAAHRALRSPATGSVAVVGAIVGLAALTRPEAALFAPFLVLPLAWRTGSDRGQRVRHLTAGLGAAALVVAPWIGVNLIRFDRPVLLTNSLGSVVAESSCDSTYYGEFIGYQANCHPDFPLPAAFGGEEDEREAALLDRADGYVADNAGRLPLVGAARVGRVWDVFNPRQNADLNASYEGRGDRPSQLGLLAYWALVPLAVVGVVALRRRRTSLLPELSTVLVVTTAAALTFGLTRYRVPAEVALVAVAAVGADDLWRRRGQPRGERGRGEDDDGDLGGSAEAHMAVEQR
jgi:4-amino-4-deoxy-L-arabinose transferase-like glycosyltransferase